MTRKGRVALGCRGLRLDDQMVTVEFAVMDAGIVVDILLGIWRHRT